MKACTRSFLLNMWKLAQGELDPTTESELIRHGMSCDYCRRKLTRIIGDLDPQRLNRMFVGLCKDLPAECVPLSKKDWKTMKNFQVRLKNGHYLLRTEPILKGDSK